MDQVLDIKELTMYLHCSESTVRKLVRTNAIPYYRVAKRIFFRKIFIDKWIADQCENKINIEVEA